MLRSGVIFKILGLLLMLFSSSYVLPMLVSVIYNDGKLPFFTYAFLITFSLGALIWMPCARYTDELRARDGFMITVLFWFVLGLAGSLPFLLSAAPDLGITDAVLNQSLVLPPPVLPLFKGWIRYPSHYYFTGNSRSGWAV